MFPRFATVLHLDLINLSGEALCTDAALRVQSRVTLPKEVVFAKHGRTVVLTLNRPPANLVNRAVLTALDSCVERAVADKDARVIVVTGGDRVFSEGLDTAEFDTMTAKEQRGLVLLGQKALWRLEHSPKPTIAAMAGKVFGAGLEIALACDVRFTSEDAQFGHPEISQSLIPMFGNTYRLEKLIGRSRSRSLIFFCEPIPAWEALEIGLVGRVAPQGAILEEARIAAGRIASQPENAVQAAKVAMLRGDEREFREALDGVVESLAGLRGWKQRANPGRRSLNRE